LTLLADVVAYCELDVEMLLHSDPTLPAEIEQDLPDLPEDARRLWQRFA
jgi:hypothetical protein